jgi:gamma-glutamyltranspeptidase/glutathione hydrolase
MSLVGHDRIALAAPHPAALAAGHDAVAVGGNVVDAAVAAAITLAVVYPHQCSLGGDLFAVLRRSDGSMVSINASGAHGSAAGGAARIQAPVPLTGPGSVTVPGAASGWARLLETGGSLPSSELLGRAAALAAGGVPVCPGLAAAVDDLATAGTAQPELLRLLTDARASGVLRQPALAATLECLADDGLSSLYDGRVAERLAVGFARLGVPVTRADLGDHEVLEDAPWSIETPAMRVWTAPPNSQGYLLLTLLAACERLADDLAVGDELLAGLFARAEACRTAELADPGHVRLSRSQLLDPDRLLDDAAELPGPLPAATGDTVAVTAVSADGTAVSLIQSVFHSFGAQLLEPDTGLVLHNRGSMFSADPASPNYPARGKRPAHTLMPVIVEHADGRVSACGAMGGRAQPQIHVQVLRGILGGRTPQEAVAAPRFVVRDGVVLAEPGADLADAETRQLPGPSDKVGHAMVCTMAPDGSLAAGIDPRSDGLSGTHLSGVT